ncbi:MAG: TonB-dependent receptor [Gemmatimonadales bacterium]
MAPGPCLCVLALLSPPRGDSVYGVVRDAATGDPIAGVEIEAPAIGTTVTDRAGAYVIRASGPGFRHLRFNRGGFEELAVDVTVPEHRSIEVNVALDPVPVTLPPISVAAPSLVSATGSSNSEIGLRRYTPESLRSDPLVSPDDPIVAAVSEQSTGGQPGAFRPLRVHGGSADQNLVLLDGLPIYGLSHLGGSAGAIDPDLIGRVDLHTAAPPAEYGGRLSSVMDLHLRAPDPHAVQLSGAWSQLAVRQSVSAPLGSGGAFQLSVRRSYRGLFPGDVNDAEQNGFGDVLLHASVAGARDRLSAYVVGGSDNLVFPTVPHLHDDQSRIGNGFDWSQRTAGLVWRHRLESGLSVDTRIWDARAEAEIGWGAGSSRQDVASTVHDMGMSFELSPAGPDAAAVLGLSVSRPGTRYALTGAPDSGGGPVTTLSLASAPVLVAVFGQRQWRLGRRWSVTSGLRISSAGLHDALLEPRLSSRWDVTDRLSLLAGYSRTHQFVQSLRNEESVLDYAVGVELPVAVGAGGVQAAESDQVSGALVARLGAGSIFRLDGYARSLRHLLIVPSVTTGPFAREAAPSGSGSARGVEIGLAREGAVLDLRLSLGADGGDRRVADQRFTPGALRSRWLAAGAGLHVDSRTVLRLAGSAASGAPTTPIAEDVVWGAPGVLSQGGEIEGTPETTGGALNRDRLPAVWRVDVGLVRDWQIIALGKPGTLTTSITLSNLFDVRNPLAYAVPTPAGARRALYFPSRTLGAQVNWRF